MSLHFIIEMDKPRCMVMRKIQPIDEEYPPSFSMFHMMRNRNARNILGIAAAPPFTPLTGRGSLSETNKIIVPSDGRSAVTTKSIVNLL